MTDKNPLARAFAELGSLGLAPIVATPKIDVVCTLTPAGVETLRAELARLQDGVRGLSDELRVLAAEYRGVVARCPLLSECAASKAAGYDHAAQMVDRLLANVSDEENHGNG